MNSKKCGVTFQNETRDGRLVSIKTRFPLQNLGWFMKLLLKKRRMCLWVIMGLTLQSSLLCCHMISFIFNHSFISYHILSFYVQISFQKSLYLSHICNSHILEVLKIFLYFCTYIYLHGYRIARIIMVYKKNQNWG